LINIAPVPKRNEELRNAWKQANERVRQAEERLGGAWAAYTSGKGAPPDKEMLAEVTRLRRECDQHLSALLEEFGPADRAKRGKERPGA
jgi:hypothetical protein